MSPTLLFFAGTLFVSAFLLFLVQPMVGKMILPRLGGTPQVWNTCVVFFQTALLAGYAYTHSVSTRLGLRAQITVHGILLLVPITVLFLMGRPFNIDIMGPPPFGVNPIPWTLGLLTLVVGLPFFVVSTSAPLLQKWFAATGDPAAKDPYFLYGASNLGSMLALLMYPPIVEPSLTLYNQAWTWAIGYLVLAVLVFACAMMVWRAPPAAQLAATTGPDAPPLSVEHPQDAPPPQQVKAGPAPATTSPHVRKGLKGPKGPRHLAPAAAPPKGPPRIFTLPETRSDEMTWPRRLRWIGLAAVPSSLMLGVTTYMSTDVSAIPLFWVIPLALYLLTFIFVFMTAPVPWTGVPHTITLIVQPFALLALVYVVARGMVSPIWLSTLILVVGFFITALMCHGELARDRPGTKHLTEFYLWMSVGGMLGGMFNGLIAPVMFYGLAELPIAIALSCFLRPRMGQGGWVDTWLASSFPGLADQPAQAPEGDTAQPTLLRKDAGQTFHVLNYSLDVALPVALLIFMGLTLFNQDPIWNFLRDVGEKWLRMGTGTRSFVYYSHLIIIYGLPILFAFMLSHRPLRFGLAVAAIFAINGYHDYVSQSEKVLARGRSYFGILRVLETKGDFGDGAPITAKEATAMNESWSGDPKLRAHSGQRAPYHYLMHGTTYHGLNFQSPPQLRRLATTYYHRFGPTGVVMEKLNWFPGPQNTYWADARMPVSLVAAGFMPLCPGGLPANELVALWSEPPYATIGLGTGTMASYARPFQTMHFYEIDYQILNYNLPAHSLEENLAILKKNPEDFGKDQPFNYLTDAIRRGANLHVLMGDARLRMGMPYKTLEEAREEMKVSEADFYAQTPEGVAWRNKAREMSGGPEDFYRAIEVDAFSSDAIPVHLITREGIEIYFKKSRIDGVVMVHTSNRHVDLVSPVTDVAKDLGKVWRRAEDSGRGDKTVDGEGNYGTGLRGHFQSQYVMLANPCEEVDEKGKQRSRYYYLPPETEEVGERGTGPALRWSTPRAPGSRVWTDDYSNLLSVFRW